jgi:hypothetical protein
MVNKRVHLLLKIILRPNLCLILKTELQESSRKYHCNKILLVTAFIALYKHVSISILYKLCLYFIIFIYYYICIYITYIIYINAKHVP